MGQHPKVIWSMVESSRKKVGTGSPKKLIPEKFWAAFSLTLNLWPLSQTFRQLLRSEGRLISKA
jgi:hypothetical protein